MIALWLLAAHLVGDYLLQTRWQAVGKFGWSREAIAFRTRHVWGYVTPFALVAVVYAGPTLRSWLFVVLLGIVHFLTDAQRFTRTPGEWFVWRFWRSATPAAVAEREADWRTSRTAGLPPNPWPSIGLAIDQTLHVIQIVVLATLFLT